MMRMILRAIACAAIASICLLSQVAFAQDDASQRDYLSQSGDWNGLRDFIMLARAEQVEIEVLDTLDYSALSTDKPVLIVYPNKDALRADSLGRFVVDGGRVLVADDFGKSRRFLERLDISRVEPLRGTLPHYEFLQNNPALPIVRTKGVHPLLEQVDVVVANHPSVLYNIGGPVLSFDEAGGLLYDMNLGKGKALVLSDSSLLINHMLLVADNAQLTRNLLAYLCKESSPGCTVQLFAGAFEQTSSYRPEDGVADREQILENVSSFNEQLDQLMRDIPVDTLFYYLSILLAAGLAIYLYTIFPITRTRPYSVYISDVQDRIHPPQSEFDWNLTRFTQGSASLNYALPVSILKELFEQLFLRELGLWEVDAAVRPKIPEIGRLFGERYLRDRFPADEARKIEGQVIDLLATFAQVPTRHRVFLDSDIYFGERDMLRLHERSLTILELMGLKEHYERRTRTTV